MVNFTPVVSVIMNGLNCQEYLQEAIDSVFAQTWADWEIIFFDNCSTDDTAKMAKSYGEKVRYFKSDKTLPLGAARNLAIEKAQGGYIAFLDCDDVWLPQKLEKQLNLFNSNPSFAMVFCDAFFFSKENVSLSLFAHRPPAQGLAFRSMLKNYEIPMSTTIFRRNILNDIGGGFDERFNMVEDADFFLRMAYYYPMGYVNEALVKRRMHDRSWTATRKELFPKEEEEMLKKFASMWPSFEADFSEEIRFRRCVIGYQQAMVEWEKGNAAVARERLGPFLKDQKKWLLAYLFSFVFSYSVYKKLKGCFKGALAPFKGSFDDQAF
ncbi:MAG: glycosyltransferase family 2 protein [Candidatus Omnitrophica bacterium]|nr:glycosyltransferase family 2 protein [Candidatus Omnitrophota bacterium]